MATATYDPSRFDVSSLDEAAAIILTPEGSTTNARWLAETPYLLDLIGENCRIDHRSIILDYGCGIGRLAKGLIERYGCRVVGADMSPSMRAHAQVYVNDPRFVACAPEAIDWLPVQFDMALAVWVLQHCLNPAEDINRMRARLAPNAPVFIVNNYGRAVPTREQAWANDGIDVAAQLDRVFARVKQEPTSPQVLPQDLAKATFWGLWRNAPAAVTEPI